MSTVILFKTTLRMKFIMPDESTDIADFGNVILARYSSKEGKMIQVTSGYGDYIQLNKEDAAKVARALGQWANSK